MLRPSKQRGAAAVFVAISLLAGLLGVALAIDLGRLFFAQRDLQRMANMAALDAARVGSGCLGSFANLDTAAQDEAQASVARNGGVGVTTTAVLGRQMTDADRIRRFDTSTQLNRRAVEVTLRAPGPGRVLPAGNAAQLTARAAALSAPSARIFVGSRLASVSPPVLNSVLSEALGGPVSLDALTYQALLGAEIPIAGLLAQLPGSPAIPPTDGETTTGLLRALVQALEANGDPAAAAGAQALYDAADGSRRVVPSDLLGQGEPVADAFINGGDLITGLVTASLEDAVFNLDLPPLPPPLGDITEDGSLGDAGTTGDLFPGGTGTSSDNFVHNTQVLLQGRLGLTLPILGNVAQLGYFLDAGQSTAEVNSIECGRRGLGQDLVNVSARSSIARLGIGLFDDINAPNPTPQPVTVVDTDSALTLLGIPVPIRVVMRASAFVNIGRAENEQLPPLAQGDVYRLGTPSAQAMASALAEVPGALQLETEITVNGAVPPLVAGLVNPAIAGLRNTLEDAVRDAIADQLAPLLGDRLATATGALGATIGGADVVVQQIDAAQPELFTR